MNNQTKAKVELPGQRLYTESIYLDTFGLGDVKELFIINKTDDDERLVSLIGRHCSFPVMDLYSSDFWYILHWERINSYPQNPMQLRWKCRHCGHSNVSKVTSKNLVQIPLDQSYVTEGVEIQLASIPERIGIRLQKVRDEFDVKKYYMQEEKVMPDQGQVKEGMIAAMLSLGDMKLKDKIKFVKSKFTPDDVYIIDQFETEYRFGIENYVEVNCSKKECGEKAEVALNFSLTSFFPSLSDSRSIRDRVFPRKASIDNSDGCTTDGLPVDPVDSRTSPSGVVRASDTERKEEKTEGTKSVQDIVNK